MPDYFAIPSVADLFATVVFSTIGFAAFLYGRKEKSWKPMTVGLTLMIYPYFVAQTWLLYAAGLALCAALYYWRD